mmetsp:Transcript_37655/g.84174  ORF Transcript_37655/g.84174 Transcript_37655/m.84174 type:complete len:100 (+) Transcript_37655:511-810(+)
MPVLQNECHPYLQQKDLFDFCNANNVGFQVCSVQCCGLLRLVVEHIFRWAQFLTRRGYSASGSSHQSACGKIWQISCSGCRICGCVLSSATFFPGSMPC